MRDGLEVGVMENRHKKLERRPLGSKKSPQKKPGTDLNKYIGANLIKNDGDLSQLQKRALDLTGVPLINFNAKHDKDKLTAHRTQSLNVTKDELQQIQHLMYMQQLQLSGGGQYGYVNYDSGHGSLDGSSCGSDHDLAEDFGLTSKRMLEAANSMPLLPSYDADDKNVEIEVEDEKKYLPTDLFQDEHPKLCSTKSLTVWDEKKQGVRKTASSDGFTLFSSDQLDLLGSIRSDWEKSSDSVTSVKKKHFESAIKSLTNDMSSIFLSRKF